MAKRICTVILIVSLYVLPGCQGPNSGTSRNYWSDITQKQVIITNWTGPSQSYMILMSCGNIITLFL